MASVSTTQPTRVRTTRRRIMIMGQPLGWFDVIAYSLLLLWAIICLLPLYWMFSTSFRVSSHMLETPPQFWPNPATLDNYRRLLLNATVLRWFWNSVVVSSSITAINIFFCTLAGYTFAKKVFPGRQLIFWAFMAMLMVPSQVTLVPLYILMGKLRFVDSYWGLIIPGLFSPFGIFLMRQFVGTLPSELIDAAKIDGASEFRVFMQVIFPLSQPGWAALGIFTFIENWNDFLWPLVITSQDTMRTLQVGLATLQSRVLTDYGMLMAGAAISAVPMIIVFLLFQRYFVRGLTLGSVKG